MFIQSRFALQLYTKKNNCATRFERVTSIMANFRCRVAIRYGKLADSYEAFVILVALVVHTRTARRLGRLSKHSGDAAGSSVADTQLTLP